MIVRAPARLHTLLQSCLSLKGLLRELNPGTSRTLSENHTTRPSSRLECMGIFKCSQTIVGSTNTSTDAQTRAHTQTDTNVIAMFCWGGAKTKNAHRLFGPLLHRSGETAQGAAKNKDARNFARGHCFGVGGSQKTTTKNAQMLSTSVAQEGRAMDTGNCTST